MSKSQTLDTVTPPTAVSRILLMSGMRFRPTQEESHSDSGHYFVVLGNHMTMKCSGAGTLFSYNHTP